MAAFNQATHEYKQHTCDLTAAAQLNKSHVKIMGCPYITETLQTLLIFVFI